MINFFSKFKIFFYVINLLLIILYLFPGSLLGCIFFDNCKVQPQITSDFLQISSNHFYAFGLITILGYLTFLNSEKLKIVLECFDSVRIKEINFLHKYETRTSIYNFCSLRSRKNQLD